MFRLRVDHSEYVKNTGVIYGAFNAYLLVSELDALCDFLFVDTFTDAMATAKCNMQVFDVKKWLLDVLVRANTRGIYKDPWNKHCKTLDRIIQCYDKYKTLYVLDMAWSDYKPALEP